MSQPPSGGCVLKRFIVWIGSLCGIPAAFGRLCVETDWLIYPVLHWHPAAFGRLCVETVAAIVFGGLAYPAAFGRLCVETPLSHW